MNINMTPEQIHRRISEIPDPVRVLGYHNPTISKLMAMYGAGEIITLQELLCRLIIALDETSRNAVNTIIEMHRNNVNPTIMPPGFKLPEDEDETKETVPGEQAQH